MRKLHEVAPSYLKDMKKRAAREYSTNNISKQDFDTVFAACDSIQNILPSSEKADKKGQNEDEGAKKSKRVDGKAVGSKEAKGTT